MLIILDDRSITYFRTYGNILDILANVMGLLNPLLVIGGLLVQPLSNISFDLLLCNKLFTFEKLEAIKNKKIFPENVES